MITQIRLENFKCFRDLVTVDLKPITVFVGPNSGGKSTLTQPLLLLKQTVLANEASQKLFTYGPIIDMGDAKSIFNISRPNDPLGIGISLTETSIHPEGDYLPVNGSTTINDRKYNFNPVTDINISIYPNDVLNIRNLEINKYTFINNNINNLHYVISTEQDHLAYRNNNDILLNNIIINGSFGNYDVGLLNPMSEHVDDEGNLTLKMEELDNADELRKIKRMISGWIGNINYFTKNIYFIPAIRHIPKFYNEYQGIDLNDNSNSYLNRIVKGYTKERPTERKAYVDNIIEDRWFNELCIGKKLISRAYKHGMELLVESNDGSLINVAAMGIGISQLMPIILLSKIGEIDSIIIQEPESHLHPSIQRKLSEMLSLNVGNRYDEIDHICTRNEKGKLSKIIQMSLGSQYIIETHSEHIVRGFQIAVAKGLIRNTDVGIYYVDASQTEPIIPMNLDEKGILVNDWPNDFYGFSFAMAMELKRYTEN